MISSPHRRVACWTSDHTAVSYEWWQELYNAGAGIAVLQLQDARAVDGMWIPVPRFYVDRLKQQGWRVWGAVRPSGNPQGGNLWTPVQTASWVDEQCRKLALQGMQFNFEDEVQKADLGGYPGWSEEFCETWRELRPTMPSQLTTYPVEGLNHAPYIAKHFRLSGETFSGGVNAQLWEWPPAWYRNKDRTGWAQRVGWPSGMIKICLPVHTIEGEQISVAGAIMRMREAGVVGCTLYPINQAMPPATFLTPLTQRLVESGCADARP